MWQEIWDKQYSHKGHWLYEGPDSLFVGVELESEPDAQTILQRNQILLAKYAYWKHVGAYTELGKVHDSIHQELRERGIHADWPSVEIYGHWAEDETELETEVLVSI